MADVNVSFGAVDTEVARAAQRLVGDLDRTRQRFESGWNRTSKNVGKQMLGAFGFVGAARSIVGSVATGLKEYAKASDDGARAMARLDEAQRKFYVSLGADYSPFLNDLSDIISAIGEYRNALSSAVYSMGSGETATAKMIDTARREEVALTARNKALRTAIELRRSLEAATARSQGRPLDAARAEETYLHQKNVADIKAKPRQDQATLLDAEEERHRSEVERIELEMDMRKQKNQMDQVAMRRAAAESEARMKAQMSEQSQALEFAVMEANIGRMRAEGRTKEAAAEQIRLDTLRQILEIKKMEFATDEAKASAISAIYRQQNAELAALDTDEPKDTKRSGQTGSIAAGLAMAGTFGQVFGGSSSSDPVVRETRGVKDQVAKLLPVLKQIQTNTAKASGATYQ